MPGALYLTDEDFVQVADLAAIDMPYLRVRIHSKANVPHLRALTDYKLDWTSRAQMRPK